MGHLMSNYTKVHSRFKQFCDLLMEHNCSQIAEDVLTLDINDNDACTPTEPDDDLHRYHVGSKEKKKKKAYRVVNANFSLPANMPGRLSTFHAFISFKKCGVKYRFINDVDSLETYDQIISLPSLQLFMQMSKCSLVNDKVCSE